VREALFSALDARLGTLTGIRFLDVFAGSGAVGLEAASRGAEAVTMIEADRGTAASARANLRQVRLGGVTVIAAKAESQAAGPPPAEPFDVAFFDPPYEWPAARLNQVVADMAGNGWLQPGAIVVVERSRRDRDWVWPPSIEPLQSKRYGETMLWYGRLSSG
jgi:16S rRNA (guanine966-N2)-methyltransferase